MGWLRRSWDAQASLAVTSTVAGVFGAPVLVVPWPPPPASRCPACQEPAARHRLAGRLHLVTCRRCDVWSVGPA